VLIYFQALRISFGTLEFKGFLYQISASIMIKKSNILAAFALLIFQASTLKAQGYKTENIILITVV